MSRTIELLAASAFVSLAVWAAACGSGPVAAGGSSEGARAATTGDVHAREAAAAALGPQGDAICGDHWKWDGTRCAPLDVTAKNEAQRAAAGADAGTQASGGGGRSGDDDEGQGGPVGGSANVAQLIVEDVKVGGGAEAKSGDNVKIHYVGTLLQDGKEFDSSRKRGQPFEFRLGSGMVIKGFDRAVTGMKVGGLRKVTIPPELGYGRRGVPGTIPPNATLVFEIELLDVT